MLQKTLSCVHLLMQHTMSCAKLIMRKLKLQHTMSYARLLSLPTLSWILDPCCIQDRYGNLRLQWRICCPGGNSPFKTFYILRCYPQTSFIVVLIHSTFLSWVILYCYLLNCYAQTFYVFIHKHLSLLFNLNCYSQEMYIPLSHPQRFCYFKTFPIILEHFNFFNV